jgi:hypothetical protein
LYCSEGIFWVVWSMSLELVERTRKQDQREKIKSSPTARTDQSTSIRLAGGGS